MGFSVFLDTEYIFPGMSAESGRPTFKDKREVVQIAAVEFSPLPDFQECSVHDILVKPVESPIVPAFFEQLTGIPQCDVDKYGLSLEKALKILHDNYCHHSIFTYDADYEVLSQNCARLGIEMPFKRPFIRVKQLLMDAGIDVIGYSSGTLYKLAGIEMQGYVHNALHDVRSMAAAMLFFHGTGECILSD